MNQEELNDQVEWFLGNRVNAADVKALTMYMVADSLDVSTTVAKAYTDADLRRLIGTGEFTDIVNEVVQKDFTYKMAKWLYDKGYEIILP